MNADIHQLRDHPLFRDLPPRALAQLTVHAVRIEYPKGSIVVREGDPGDALFVVLSGRCQATLHLPHGVAHVQEIYAPGDTFGKRALLSRDSFGATVSVITDCVLLRLAGPDVRAVLERNAGLEKELFRRVFGQVRELRLGQAPEKIGRIAVLCSLAAHVRGSEIAHNLATAIRQETGRSVLNVAIVGGPGGPTLADWKNMPACTLDALRSAAEVRKSQSGLWELQLHARDNADEAACVAPVLSHLALYARILMIHADASVPEIVLRQLLIQSDSPCLLVGSRSNDLRRAADLIRQLQQHPAHEWVQPQPILCLEAGEPARAHDDVRRRLGMPAHAILPELPGTDADAHDFYTRHPTERFSVRIRQWAREIGRCRIGLALSSGGAKALAHIGVIQVLEEQGIDVDVVAGTSMGAMIAALWAYGIDGHTLERLARRNEKNRGIWSLIDPIFPPRQGFIGGVRILEIVREIIGNAHFADMRRQLRIVAADLDTMERVVFTQGEIAPIVHASMAMPGIVVPVRLDGRNLVDGGVAEPLPVNVLEEMGIERIIAVNTIPTPADVKASVLQREEQRAARGPQKRRRHLLHHYLNYFAQGNILDIWSKSMLAAETRVAEGACQLADLVMRPVLCEGRWHDFGNPGKYIAIGRRTAEENMEAIRRLAS